jgi:hypothetical protein
MVRVFLTGFNLILSPDLVNRLREGSMVPVLRSPGVPFDKTVMGRIN